LTVPRRRTRLYAHGVRRELSPSDFTGLTRNLLLRGKRVSLSRLLARRGMALLKEYHHEF
jgi:hypothetical protein